MQDDSAARDFAFEEAPSGLDSILGRLGSLGDETESAPPNVPTLYSVPDLPPDSTNGETVEAAALPTETTTPELTLVTHEPAPVATAAEVSEVVPAPVATAADVVIAPAPAPAPTAQVASAPELDVSPVASPESEDGRPPRLNSFTKTATEAMIGAPESSIPETDSGIEPPAPAIAPDTGFLADYQPTKAPQTEQAATVTSTPIVQVETEVDLFASLDDGEPVTIAGVNDSYLTNNPVPAVQPVPTAHQAPQLSSEIPSVPPYAEASEPVAPADIFADPLDIKDVFPENLDAQTFAQSHGVAFPASVAGSSAARPIPELGADDVATTDVIVEDHGKLNTRLLIVSTVLFALIALAVTELQDPMILNGARDGVMSLLGR